MDVLARQGDEFRRLLEPKRDDSLYQLATFLTSFDISTAYPLLLFLLDTKVSESEWITISIMLESYLLRRSVCKLTTKNYNRIFLELARFLQQKGATAENVCKYLSGLSGESGDWPNDTNFSIGWQNSPTYDVLDNRKIVYILQRLNQTYFSSKTERINIDSQLTIEHIMPQAWLEYWPLPDGSKGMATQEVLESEEGNSVAEATRRRNSVLDVLGNLTILTQALNSTVSNGAWNIKKPEMLKASLLPINQQLIAYDTWTEETIDRRGKELFERAKSIWPASSKNTVEVAP